MPRYFIELAYNGSTFSGWQRQPHSPSVQQTIEEAISLMLRTPILITGCGRTDTGVHADDYFAHFDFAGEFPARFPQRLNRFLPDSILIKAIYAVGEEEHARFDASLRAYRYEIDFRKNPFQPDTVTVFPFYDKVDLTLLQKTADLIGSYGEFTPFCKTNSDAKTMNCQISRAEWVLGDEHWTFHVSANRFLRGMVRLIVGTCLEVGQGKLKLSEVKTALDQQTPLPRAWRAPAAGLFLTSIDYPKKRNWTSI
jgi:tRNA pseudouridine38-40 synthase